MKWLIFDTETNGLPKKETDLKNNEIKTIWPSVIQLSWIIYDDIKDKIIVEQDYIITLPSNEKINEESKNIHRISENRIKNGINIELALNMFASSCDIVQGIVGHNVNFDINVLLNAAKKTGIRCGLENPKALFCTMNSSKNICNLINHKGYLKSPKLIELHNILFKSEPKDLHNALIDIRVCFRCFYYLMYKEDPLGNRNLLPFYKLKMKNINKI